MKIDPIFSENVSGVFVASTLDTRKPKELYPVAVRVTYLRKVWYYQTGTALAYEDYEKVVRANKGKGQYSMVKDQIKTRWQMLSVNWSTQTAFLLRF